LTTVEAKQGVLEQGCRELRNRMSFLKPVGVQGSDKERGTRADTETETEREET
jgi:hypothetical protein